MTAPNASLRGAGGLAVLDHAADVADSILAQRPGGVIDRARSGALRGKVSDAARRPLPNVTVSTLDNPTVGTARTHLVGHFDMARTPPRGCA